MRKIATFVVAIGLLSLAGCGCLVEFGEKTGIRYPDHLYPDPNQPAWDRCLFGRKHGIGPGNKFFELYMADTIQPGWHQLLFGTRYVEIRSKGNRAIGLSVPPCLLLVPKLRLGTHLRETPFRGYCQSVITSINPACPA